jgi:hypothetical protein
MKINFLTKEFKYPSITGFFSECIIKVVLSGKCRFAIIFKEQQILSVYLAYIDSLLQILTQTLVYLAIKGSLRMNSITLLK